MTLNITINLPYKTIAVFGTGSVGQTIAKKLVHLGHTVVIGTRNVSESLAKTESDGMGGQPISNLIEANPTLKIATFAEDKLGADLIILAVSGKAALSALELAGELPAGQIVLDITNPLDFSNGFPPSLFTPSTTSLSEQIQAKYPHIHIVKSLNTMANNLMVNPTQLKESGVNFICGNDNEAKNHIKTLLKSFGWEESSIMDLGDLVGARGMEMSLPLWIRVFQSRGNGNFNWKIVD
jgi:8-hydroxy-5-deazaflavin:NADPH oxidoreductase